MPEFQTMFEKSNYQPIKYKGKVLVRSDQFPVENKIKLMLTFEKTNSEWKQGVCLDVNGYFEIFNHKIKRSMISWEYKLPKQIEFIVLDTLKKPEKYIRPQKGYILVCNAWDTGNGAIDKGHNGAAMIVEEIENGRRYWCNDGHPDDNFDDIVFRIERVT